MPKRKRNAHYQTREPAVLKLRLLDYPAWRVEVNEAVVLPEQNGETPDHPYAGQLDHHVWFGAFSFETPDRTIGGL